MKVCSVVGIRPQYIKMSILMLRMRGDPDVEQVIVNTGQHYDYEMARGFFKELGIPDADYNLGVGSGSHAEQTAKMLLGIEEILRREQPDLSLVVGDGNPTLAGALASAKIQIPVAHVEAGLRSYNWRMAEEVNRVLVDHCSHLLFAPTENAVKNLLKEGIEKNRVFLTGDVTVDIVREYMKQVEESGAMRKLGLRKKSFILMTLHRAENVDEKVNLENILKAVSNFGSVVFPVHPRTQKRIEEFGLSGLTKDFVLTDPLGYADFLSLLENASVVVTDSGGVQKEAFLVRTPCVTVRNETEWVETVSAGANVLAGADDKKIVHSIRVMRKRLVEVKGAPFGSGDASSKIVEVIKRVKLS